MKKKLTRDWTQCRATRRCQLKQKEISCLFVLNVKQSGPRLRLLSAPPLESAIQRLPPVHSIRRQVIDLGWDSLSTVSPNTRIRLNRTSGEQRRMTRAGIELTYQTSTPGQDYRRRREFNVGEGNSNAQVGLFANGWGIRTYFFIVSTYFLPLFTFRRPSSGELV